MIKRSILQEDIEILMYMYQTKELQVYMKQKLIERWNRQTLNTPLSTFDRITRKKVSKDIEELNDNIN